MSLHRSSTYFSKKSDMSDIDLLGNDDVNLGSSKELLQTALTLIQPETWNNIPVCIVKAFQSMIDHCKVQDQMIRDTNALIAEKDKKNAQRFVKMEKSLVDKEESINKTNDQRERLIHDKIRKTQIDLDSYIQNMEVRQREIQEQTIYEKMKLDEKLNNVEEVQKLKGWIQAQMHDQEYKLSKQSSKRIEEVLTELKAIKEDNLVIPGLVGKDEGFKNLKGWIGFQNTHVHNSLNDFGSKFEERIQKASNKMMKQSAAELKELKEQIKAQLEISNDKVTSDITSMVTLTKQEMLEKLLSIKQDQSSSSNALQHLDKKVEKVQQQMYSLKNGGEASGLVESLREHVQQELLTQDQLIEEKITEIKGDMKETSIKLTKALDKFKMEQREAKKSGSFKDQFTEKQKKEIKDLIDTAVSSLRQITYQSQSSTQYQSIGGASAPQGTNQEAQSQLNQTRQGSNLLPITAKPVIKNDTQKQSKSNLRPDAVNDSGIISQANKTRNHKSFFNPTQSRSKSTMPQLNNSNTIGEGVIEMKTEMFGDNINEFQIAEVSTLPLNSRETNAHRASFKSAYLQEDNEKSGERVSSSQLMSKRHSTQLNKTQYLASFNSKMNNDVSFRDEFQMPPIKNEAGTIYSNIDNNTRTQMRFKNSKATQAQMRQQNPSPQPPASNIQLGQRFNPNNQISQPPIKVKFESLGGGFL